MKKPEESRRLLGIALCALLLAACGTQQEEAGGAADPQEFAFAGTVEGVDATARIVSVHTDDIPGWMMSMSMRFNLDDPEMIDSLKVGDRITATVYEGNFTTLYDVAVAQP